MLLNEIKTIHELILPIAIITVFLVIITMMRRRANQVLKQQLDSNAELEKAQLKNTQQLQELRAIVLGFSDQLSQQKELIKNNDERLIELEMVDGDSRLYTRANKMLQLGADVDELILECELPKAEAELMMSLQNKITGKEAIPPL